MDKPLQTDTDTYFSERYSNILVRFRIEDSRNVALRQNIEVKKKKVKGVVSSKVWEEINSLIKLVSVKSHIESKYLYIQGIKDCIDLNHFLDTEYKCRF